MLLNVSFIYGNTYHYLTKESYEHHKETNNYINMEFSNNIIYRWNFFYYSSINTLTKRINYEEH